MDFLPGFVLEFFEGREKLKIEGARCPGDFVWSFLKVVKNSKNSFIAECNY